MIKKEDTPERNWRRTYELKHKEERENATSQFNTRIPKKDYEEICAFLKEHNIGKIDLIYAGYAALKEQRNANK